MTDPKPKREVDVSETLVDSWDDAPDAFVTWNPDGTRVDPKSPIDDRSDSDK